MLLRIGLQLANADGPYALARHVSALGLIDLPAPEKILLMLAKSRSEIAGGAIYDANRLIADLQFDEGGGAYLKLDEISEDEIRGVIPISKLAAIKVCRQIGISSTKKIPEFNDVVRTCLIPGSPGGILDPEAVNYARIVLHRLSKGRGVGLAEIDGMPIAADIVEHVIPDVFIDGLIAHAELDELCKWTGTFASVYCSGEGRSEPAIVRQDRVNAMAEKCLERIAEAADPALLTPRAFSSICKAIKNIRPFSKSTELSKKLLELVEFRQALEYDYNKNLVIDPSFENMSRRINTTVSLFVTLLRRAGQDKEALALLENWNEQLPTNDYGFKLESQCRLQRLNLVKKRKLTHIDLDDEFAAILTDLQDRQGSSVVKIRELLAIIRHRQGQQSDTSDLSDEFDLLYELTRAALDEIPNQLLCQVAEQFALRHFVQPIMSDRDFIGDLLEFCRTSDGANVLFYNYISILTVLAGLAKYPFDDRLPKVRAVRASHALALAVELLKTSSDYVQAAEVSLIDGSDIEALFWGTSALFRKNPELGADLEAALTETLNQLERGVAA